MVDQRHVIYPRPSSRSTSAHSSGSILQSSACSSGVVGLNRISVRSLAGLGEKMSSDDSLLAYRSSSQASSPRIVASPQLPSPRTVFYELSIWYHDSRGRNRNKVQGTFTPQDHAHRWAYCNGGREQANLKWSISLASPLNRTVELNRVSLALNLLSSVAWGASCEE